MPTSRSAQSAPPANLIKAEAPNEFGADLRAVLAEFLTAVAPLRFEPITDHGGLSGAQIWRVYAGDASFALRLWPAEYPSPERLRFIHAVLEHTMARGFHTVPVPLRTRDGNSFVERGGRLWELAPWLPGEANYELEPCREKMAAAMRVLAGFHLAGANFRHGESSIVETRLRGAAAGLGDRANRLRQLDSAAIDSLGSAVENCPVGRNIDELARSIHAELSRAAASARPILEPAISLNLSLQPCLRDIWHGNLLFTGDQVSGIVDFGAMQIDSPALDVARLLGSMAGDDVELWRVGLAEYETVRPLSVEEHVAVRAADASGIVLGCLNWLRWLYVERRRFSDLSAVELRISKLLPRLKNLATP